MKIRIKKRNIRQWATFFAVGVLMVVRIPILMYLAQAIFLLCVIGTLRFKRLRKSDGYIACNIGFIAMSAFSVLYSSNFNNSLSSMISILQIFAISFLLFYSCSNEREFDDIIWLFTKLGWVFVVYILVATSPQQWREILATNTNLSSDAGRLGPSIGMHTNMCGAVLSILIMFSLYSYFANKKKSDLLQTGILMCCLFLTKSRMSLLITACGAAVYFAIYKRLGVKQIIRIAAMIGVLVALVIVSFNNEFLYNLYGNRVESLLFLFTGEAKTDASVTGRLALQQRAIEVFLEHPLFGVGIGDFRSYTVNLGGVSGYYAHNNFLELLADVGIIGTILYYTPYVIALVKTRAIARNAGEKKRMLYNLLFVLLIMRLTSDYAQVSYLYDSSQILLSLIFVGIKLEGTTKTRMAINYVG